MPLRGIDVASYQAGIDMTAVDGDFAICKATGGVAYANPAFTSQMDGAASAGKLLGAYHFAREASCPGSAKDEAAWFLAKFAPYIGRAIPVLDWEADATALPVSWAREWLDRVADATGAQPWFYSYSSYINSCSCADIAGYPLWVAAYYAGYDPMGYQDDPPLRGGTGAWERATAYQYTSTGRLAGWNGNLDLSTFYGTGADWAAMCGGSELTHEDKRDIARLCAEEVLNRSLAVDGERKPVPFWQLASWAYRYFKGVDHGTDR